MKTSILSLFTLSLLILAGCEQGPAPESGPGGQGANGTAGPGKPTSPPVIVSAGDKVVNLLRREAEFVMLPAADFGALGWEAPDGGRHVKQLADAAPGGAFNPRDLEALPAAVIGYRAKWHEVRFEKYGLEWDITGLYLEPVDPVPDLPTFVQIHGGSGNWYQFFMTPLNEPGLGQYLAQKMPVLLVTIPGNYRHGGWTVPPAERQPQYLLDRQPDAEEMRLRNAVFTFELINEGLVKLIDTATIGPLVVTGHSTGGELPFMLKERLRDRMHGLFYGWGTGGPARLRRTWADTAAAEHNQTDEIEYRPISEVRGRGAEGMTHGYIGPFNPFLEEPSSNIYDWYFRVISDPDLLINTARAYYQNEYRRKPYFKQHMQDIEHRGEIELRPRMEAEIRRLAAVSPLPVDAEAVIADLFATVRTDLTGYRKMVWVTSTLDEGHWAADPADARELYIANQYRQENPAAEIRVLVYDDLMTHIGYSERPRQLAGGAYAAVRWLFSDNGGGTVRDRGADNVEGLFAEAR